MTKITKDTQENKENKDIQEEKTVATLYDSPEGQIGSVLFGGHMHWGYWDESNSTDNFAQGSDRLSRIMIDKTCITKGQRFIDIGCGFGLSGIRLAKTKGCRVDGITISKFQQESAMKIAKSEKLLNKVNFLHGDALALPFDNDSFDGGWFFESIFHMNHSAALNEARRVLKSGSILTLTDLPLLSVSKNDDKFKEYVRKNIHSHFISVENYPDLLHKSGFELIKIDDITSNVMPLLVLKLTEAISTYKEKIYKFIPNPEKSIDNWIYLFKYMSKNLGYIIVTAKKR
ncbi:methyltransferase domain-containing protein, PedE homolog [Candidatus Profftella armatura (Diaphorina cf. continua)]|uniref:Methyltransferase domain-containing protein, PedE homolog n=1 Tax=Candidatus Profftella armatura (Diaphorina cf. continua) TaxID=2661583 RepID=A0A7R7ABP9_9PROT|nr:methyltransferase domain-containing protein [Candidatus Profftella armatura (Diaphorina cf. continua)]BCG49546.1 methyltransferase domain-containing protein, PedE homolog [Candidatus Profftella armatura (Diaphorina cf. continua)]